MEHESDGYTNKNCCSWYRHQRIVTRTGGCEDKGNREDHLNYSVIKIGQNPKKSLGVLRRLAVTQTPLRNHWLMLV